MTERDSYGDVYVKQHDYITASEKFEKWKKQGIFIQTSNNEPSKIECVNKGYFQFPADDKVEDLALD